MHNIQNGVLTLVKRTGGDKTVVQLNDDVDTFVNGITTALDDIHTTLWNEGTTTLCITYNGMQQSAIFFICTLHAYAHLHTYTVVVVRCCVVHAA
jgi:hypothetical protein